MLIDSEAILCVKRPRGILDQHLFLDAHHPNLVNYTSLATETLRRLRDRKAFGWPERVASPSITPAEVASSFGLDAPGWAEICRRSAEWYDASDRIARARAYWNAAKAIDERTPPERAGCPGIGVEPPPR